MELAMNQTLGPSWKEYFIIRIADCKRPLFYSSEQAFYQYDPATPDGKGRKLATDVSHD
jgi:hypothetical protein